MSGKPRTFSNKLANNQPTASPVSSYFRLFELVYDAAYPSYGTEVYGQCNQFQEMQVNMLLTPGSEFVKVRIATFRILYQLEALVILKQCFGYLEAFLRKYSQIKDFSLDKCSGMMTLLRKFLVLDETSSFNETYSTYFLNANEFGSTTKGNLLNSAQIDLLLQGQGLFDFDFCHAGHSLLAKYPSFSSQLKDFQLGLQTRFWSHCENIIQDSASRKSRSFNDRLGQVNRIRKEMDEQTEILFKQFCDKSSKFFVSRYGNETICTESSKELAKHLRINNLDAGRFLKTYFSKREHIPAWGKYLFAEEEDFQAYSPCLHQPFFDLIAAIYSYEEKDNRLFAIVALLKIVNGDIQDDRILRFLKDCIVAQLKLSKKTAITIELELIKFRIEDLFEDTPLGKAVRLNLLYSLRKREEYSSYYMLCGRKPPSSNPKNMLEWAIGAECHFRDKNYPPEQRLATLLPLLMKLAEQENEKMAGTFKDLLVYLILEGRFESLSKQLCDMINAVIGQITYQNMKFDSLRDIFESLCRKKLLRKDSVHQLVDLFWDCFLVQTQKDRIACLSDYYQIGEAWVECLMNRFEPYWADNLSFLRLALRGSEDQFDGADQIAAMTAWEYIKMARKSQHKPLACKELLVQHLHSWPDLFFSGPESFKCARLLLQFPKVEIDQSDGVHWFSMRPTVERFCQTVTELGASAFGYEKKEKFAAQLLRACTRLQHLCNAALHLLSWFKNQSFNHKLMRQLISKIDDQILKEIWECLTKQQTSLRFTSLNAIGKELAHLFLMDSQDELLEIYTRKANGKGSWTIQKLNKLLKLLQDSSFEENNWVCPMFQCIVHFWDIHHRKVACDQSAISIFKDPKIWASFVDYIESEVEFFQLFLGKIDDGQQKISQLPVAKRLDPLLAWKCVLLAADQLVRLVKMLQTAKPGIFWSKMANFLVRDQRYNELLKVNKYWAWTTEEFKNSAFELTRDQGQKLKFLALAFNKDIAKNLLLCLNEFPEEYKSGDWWIQGSQKLQKLQVHLQTPNSVEFSETEFDLEVINSIECYSTSAATYTKISNTAFKSALRAAAKFSQENLAAVQELTLVDKDLCDKVMFLNGVHNILKPAPKQETTLSLVLKSLSIIIENNSSRMTSISESNEAVTTKLIQALHTKAVEAGAGLMFRIIEDSEIFWEQFANEFSFRCLVAPKKAKLPATETGQLLKENEERSLKPASQAEATITTGAESKPATKPELIEEQKFIGFYTKSVNVVRIDNSQDSCFSKLKKIGEFRKSILDKLNRMLRTGDVFDIIGALNSSNSLPATLVKATHENSKPCITVQMKQGELAGIEALDKALKNIMDQSAKARTEFFDAVIEKKYHFWSKLSGIQLSKLLQFLNDKFMLSKDDPEPQPETKLKKQLLQELKTDFVQLLKGLALPPTRGHKPANANTQEIFQREWEPRQAMQITYANIEALNEYFRDSIHHLEHTSSQPITNNKDQMITVVYYSGKIGTEATESQAHRQQIVLHACRHRFKDTAEINDYSSYLFCNQYTSEEFIEVFLHRAVFDRHKRPYMILDMQLLHFSLRDKILRFLSSSLTNATKNLTVSSMEESFQDQGQSELAINTNITLVIPTDHKSNLLQEITTRYPKKHFFNLPTDNMEILNLPGLEKVVVVISKSAGQGKTFAIEQHCKAQGYTLLVITLAGSMTPELLDRRLAALNLKLRGIQNDSTAKLALRIKLDMVDGSSESFDYLNQLLFKLCIVQKIEYKHTLIELTEVKKFFIEVQNTSETGLESVPLVAYLLNKRDATNRWEVSIKWGVNSDDPKSENASVDASGEKALSIDYRELNKFGLREALILYYVAMRVGVKAIEQPIGALNPHDLLYRGNKSLEQDSELNPKLESFVGALDRAYKSGNWAHSGKEKDSLRLKIAYQKQDQLVDNMMFGLLKEELSNPTKDDEDQLIKHRAEIVLRSVQREIQGQYGAILGLGEGEPTAPQIERMERDLFNIMFSGIADNQLREELSTRNFFHVKTLLQLYKHFFNNFRNAKALHWESFKPPEDSTKEDKERHDFLNYRIGFTENVLKSLRSSAFEQVLSLPSAQEKHIKKVKGLQVEIEEDPPADDDFSGNKDYTFCIVKNGDIQLLQSSPESNKELRNIVVEKNKDNSVILGDTKSNTKSNDWYFEMLIDFVATLSTSAGVAETATFEAHRKAIQDRVRQRMKQEPRAGVKRRRFIFTKDNFLKMTLILQRAELGVPIILQGESGCGKTFMVDFIANTLLDDIFCSKTLHMGITEKDFEEFLKEVISKAKAAPESRLWLFLDEVNTSPLITSVCELITERKAHFMTTINDEDKQLPNNIVIVAACNPYKLKSPVADGPAKAAGESTTARLQIATETSQSSGVRGEPQQGRPDLTHKVFPIPNSMLSFVFDYGQIKQDDENPYVAGMLKDCLEELEQTKRLTSKQQGKVVNAILHGQMHIQKNGQKSSSSIRDVRRYLQLLKQFCQTYTMSESLLLAFYCGYSIRQQGAKEMNIELQAEAQEFNQDIETELKEICKVAEGKHLAIQQLFDQKSSEFLEAMKHIIPDDIATNRPLRENLFIMVHCILARIPLFICGRPGTSKSVAIEIIRKLFSKDRPSHPLFEKLPALEIYPIWGSKDTVADDVEHIFNLAKQHDQSAAETEKCIRLVVFDEVGIADANEHNPLKVLHPLLEPAQEDICPNLSFVGLSNTTLDASKMNRMLYVHRYDMRPEDLQVVLKQFQINDTLKEEVYKPSQQLSAQDIEKLDVEEWLVDSYCKYREIEAKDSVHKTFSGPRDFYSMCKWLKHNLKTITIDGCQSKEQLLLRVAKFACLSIERNFSGRKLESSIRWDSHFQRVEHHSSLVNNSSYYLKGFFMEQYSKAVGPFTSGEFLKVLERHYHSKDLVMNNLSDHQARHLMLFLEKQIYVDAVAKIFEEWWKTKNQAQLLELNKDGQDQDEQRNKIKRRRFVFMNEEGGDLISIFNNFKECVSDGSFVLLRKMDKLYPCCYDIFNQRYTQTENGKYSCKMNMGSLHEEVEVNPSFKCVILIDNDKEIPNVEKEWPTALLNRFEKHEFLKYEFYDTEHQEIERRLVHKMWDFEQHINPDYFVHNYSNLLIESAVVGDLSNTMKLVDKPHEDFLREALGSDGDSKLTTNSSEWYRDNWMTLSTKNTMTESQVSRSSADSMQPANQSDFDPKSAEDGEKESLELAFMRRFKNLHQMFNWNYLLLLHRRYPNKDQMQERDANFELYKETHKKSLEEILVEDIDSQFKIVFSLEDPRDSDIRNRWEQYQNSLSKSTSQPAAGEEAEPVEAPDRQPGEQRPSPKSTQNHRLVNKKIEFRNYQSWQTTSQIQQQLDDLVIRMYPPSSSSNQSDNIDILIISFNDKEEWESLNLFMDYIKRSITQRIADLKSDTNKGNKQEPAQDTKQVLLVAHNPVFEDIVTKSLPLIHLVSHFKPYVLDMVRWTDADQPNIETTHSEIYDKLGLSLKEYLEHELYMKEQIEIISEEMFDFSTHKHDERSIAEVRACLNSELMRKFFVYWMKENQIDLTRKLYQGMVDTDQPKKVKDVKEKLKIVLHQMVTSKLKKVFFRIHDASGLNFFLSLAHACAKKVGDFKYQPEFQILRLYVAHCTNLNTGTFHEESTGIIEISPFSSYVTERQSPSQDGSTDKLFEPTAKFMEERHRRFWQKLVDRDSFTRFVNDMPTDEQQTEQQAEEGNSLTNMSSKLITMLSYELHKQSALQLKTYTLESEADDQLDKGTSKYFCFFFKHVSTHLELFKNHLRVEGVDLDKDIFQKVDESLKGKNLLLQYLLSSVFERQLSDQASLDRFSKQVWTMWDSVHEKVPEPEQAIILRYKTEDTISQLCCQVIMAKVFFKEIMTILKIKDLLVSELEWARKDVEELEFLNCNTLASNDLVEILLHKEKRRYRDVAQKFLLETSLNRGDFDRSKRTERFEAEMRSDPSLALEIQTIKPVSNRIISSVIIGFISTFEDVDEDNEKRRGLLGDIENLLELIPLRAMERDSLEAMKDQIMFLLTKYVIPGSQHPEVANLETDKYDLNTLLQLNEMAKPEGSLRVKVTLSILQRLSQFMALNGRLWYEREPVYVAPLYLNEILNEYIENCKKPESKETERLSPKIAKLFAETFFIHQRQVFEFQLLRQSNEEPQFEEGMQEAVQNHRVPTDDSTDCQSVEELVKQELNYYNQNSSSQANRYYIDQVVQPTDSSDPTLHLQDLVRLALLDVAISDSNLRTSILESNKLQDLLSKGYTRSQNNWMVQILNSYDLRDMYGRICKEDEANNTWNWLHTEFLKQDLSGKRLAKDLVENPVKLLEDNSPQDKFASLEMKMLFYKWAEVLANETFLKFNDLGIKFLCNVQNAVVFENDENSLVKSDSPCFKQLDDAEALNPISDFAKKNADAAEQYVAASDCFINLIAAWAKYSSIEDNYTNPFLQDSFVGNAEWLLTFAKKLYQKAPLKFSLLDLGRFLVDQALEKMAALPGENHMENLKGQFAEALTSYNNNYLTEYSDGLIHKLGVNARIKFIEEYIKENISRVEVCDSWYQGVEVFNHLRKAIFGLHECILDFTKLFKRGWSRELCTAYKVRFLNNRLGPKLKSLVQLMKLLQHYQIKNKEYLLTEFEEIAVIDVIDRESALKQNLQILIAAYNKCLESWKIYSPRVEKQLTKTLNSTSLSDFILCNRTRLLRELSSKIGALNFNTKSETSADAHIEKAIQLQVGTQSQDFCLLEWNSEDPDASVLYTNQQIAQLRICIKSQQPGQNAQIESPKESDLPKNQIMTKLKKLHEVVTRMSKGQKISELDPGVPVTKMREYYADLMRQLLQKTVDTMKLKGQEPAATFPLTANLVWTVLFPLLESAQNLEEASTYVKGARMSDLLVQSEPHEDYKRVSNMKVTSFLAWCEKESATQQWTHILSSNQL